MAQVPYAFPYSLLDFGVTVLTIIVVGVLGYLYLQMVKVQHKAANDVLHELVTTCENLVRLSRDLVDTVERTHEEVWRTRMLFDKLMEKEGR